MPGLLERFAPQAAQSQAYGLLDQRRNMLTNMLLGGVGARDGRSRLRGMAQGMIIGRQTDQERNEERLERERERLQRNQTIQYAQQHNPEMVPFLQSGAITGKDYFNSTLGKEKPKREILKGADDRNRYVDDGSLVFPEIGEAPVDMKEALKAETDTSKAYRTEGDVQDYQAVRTGFEKVRVAANSPTGAGDISLLVGFMKMIDPGSVVREGELATAQNSGGVSATVRNIYNNALTGERLTESQRADFIKAAQAIHDEAAANLNEVNDIYGERADRFKINRGFIRAPEKYEPTGDDPLGIR